MTASLIHISHSGPEARRGDFPSQVETTDAAPDAAGRFLALLQQQAVLLGMLAEGMEPFRAETHGRATGNPAQSVPNSEASRAQRVRNTDESARQETDSSVGFRGLGDGRTAHELTSANEGQRAPGRSASASGRPALESSGAERGSPDSQNRPADAARSERLNAIAEGTPRPETPSWQGPTEVSTPAGATGFVPSGRIQQNAAGAPPGSEVRAVKAATAASLVKPAANAGGTQQGGLGPGGHSPRMGRSGAVGWRAAAESSRPFLQVDQSKFGAQLARSLIALIRGGGREVTVRLTPEALGSLKIRLRVDRGRVWARFEAATERARQLLEQNLPALRSAIEARGLAPDRLTVELSEQAPMRQEAGAHDAGRRTARDDTGGAEHERRDAGTASHETALAGGPTLLEAVEPEFELSTWHGRLRLNALA